MKFSTLIAGSLGLAAAHDFELVSETEYKFMAYVSQYNKSYGTRAEYNFRMAIFEQRIAEHARHNNIQGQTSSQGVNHMTDWTEAEIMRLLGARTSNTMAERKQNEAKYPEQFLAAHVDWREQGAVTSVKNQGHCGSCWTFATAGAMESAHFQATGELINLAESQWVDCDTHTGNQGCNGGDVQLAYQYAQAHPIQLLETYPYVPEDGTCKYDESLGQVKVTEWHNVRTESVSALKASLVAGPSHVSVRADRPVFHQYTGGIITSEECGVEHNHAILAVGYGVEGGIPYYIVKNSWGTGWGEEGYVRIGQKEGPGICGVQTNPTKPTTN